MRTGKKYLVIVKNIKECAFIVEVENEGGKSVTDLALEKSDVDAISGRKYVECEVYVRSNDMRIVEKFKNLNLEEVDATEED